MMRVRIPSDTVSSIGRAAHDAGLAALLGGNLYGRVAMHPALAEIGEKSERGKVVNRAWRRYGWVNSASLLAIAAGWAGARLNEARPSSLSQRERALAKGKDAAVVAVLLTGLSTANAAAELALVGINAALGQANFRRPPARRLLRKRY